MTTSTLEAPTPAPPPLHPRFRERRIKVRRDEGRRRLRRLIALAAVAAAVLSGLASTRSSLLDVDRVTVTGGAHTSTADILASAQVIRHQPMVEVDTSGAARRIAALPWVDHVRVVRRWPAAIAITIDERTAVAQVATTSGRWILIDAAGRLLETLPAPLPQLVRFTSPITGQPGDDLGGRLASSRRVAAAIDPPLDQRIAEISELGRFVELRLRGGGRVLFGPAGQVEEKLRAVDDLLTEAPRWCPIWDVRVPSAPVLTPGNGCV